MQTHPVSPTQQKLFHYNEFDTIDDIEKSWGAYFEAFKQAVPENLSESELNNKLVEIVSESSSKHSETTTGILYGILTSSTNDISEKYMTYLTISVRDGYSNIISQLNCLIHEKYPKLMDSARERLLWFVEEIVKLNIQESDTICCLLLRQVHSGDVSPKNVHLMKYLLSIFTKYIPWLYNHKKLLCASVYTFLRLICDHTVLRGNSNIQSLLPIEKKFICQCVRNRFDDLAGIGRDFIRVFYDAKLKVPEINELWGEMIANPMQNPENKQIEEICMAPTRPRYLQCRITPEMEKQLIFIMMQVKIGNQRRYQQWFSQRYLSSPECETLIIDVVRWMCSYFHPPNQIIAGNFVPRWAMIGWLLKSITNPQNFERAKLALIFDWIFFNPKADNVMNIEPAMLLMVHSIPKYMDITAGILDYLLSFAKFEPADNSRFILPKEMLTQHIKTAFQICIDKGVIRSLFVLSDCPQLDQNLKEKLKKLVPNLASNILQAPSSSHTSQASKPIPTNHSEKPQSITPQHQKTKQRPSAPFLPFSTTTSESKAINKGTTSGAGDSKPSFSPFAPTQSPVSSTDQSKQTHQSEQPLSSQQQEKQQQQLHQSTQQQQQQQQQEKQQQYQDQQKISNSVDPQIAIIFEPYLSQFVNSLDNPTNAIQNLNQLFEIYEKRENFDTSGLNTDQIACKLATFICRILASEFKLSNIGASGQGDLLKQLLVSYDQTILYSIFSYIDQSVRNSIGRLHKNEDILITANNAIVISNSQSPQIKKRITKGGKQSRDRFSLFLKYSCDMEPSIGYRMLCYCIFKEKQVMQEIEDLLPLGEHLDLTVKMTKTEDLKTFPLYEWLCNIQSNSNIQKQLSRQTNNSAQLVFINDIKTMGEESEGILLLAFLPIICKYMTHFTKNCNSFLQLIFDVLSPSQLQHTLAMISVGRIQLIEPFTLEYILSLIENTNHWDWYQQECFWKVLSCQLVVNQEELSNADNTDSSPKPNLSSQFIDLEEFFIRLIPILKFDFQNDTGNYHTCLDKMCLIFSNYVDLGFELFQSCICSNPEQFKYFSCFFILHWLYNPSAAGRYQIFKQHLNSLLRELYSNTKYKTTWKSKSEYILRNLYILKFNSVSRRKLKKRANDNINLFQDAMTKKNLIRLRKIEFPCSTFLDKLIGDEIAEKDNGIKRKNNDSDSNSNNSSDDNDDDNDIEDDEEEDDEDENVKNESKNKEKKSPVGKQVRRSARLSKNILDDEESDNDSIDENKSESENELKISKRDKKKEKLREDDGDDDSDDGDNDNDNGDDEDIIIFASKKKRGRKAEGDSTTQNTKRRRKHS